MAIIVILFMLLLPALNSVKERAKQIQCLSRLKEATIMSLNAALRNDNWLYFSGAIFDPVTQMPTNARFQYGVMARMRPDILYYQDEAWRTFVCTNVLPQWNGPSTSNRGGYPNAKDSWLTKLEWESVNPDGYTESPWFCHEIKDPGKKPPEGDGDAGPIYVLGNFNTNANGKIVNPKRKTNASTKEQASALFLVASPSKRVYIMEEGESSNSPQSNIQYRPYNEPISRGTTGEGSVRTYIPGLGGGGIGKEKMEKIGYAADVYELPQDRFELLDRDVMEGRHYGMTLHGFFDGHAEAIPVETVGSLQLGPGQTAEEDLKGPYGYFSRPADDDE